MNKSRALLFFRKNYTSVYRKEEKAMKKLFANVKSQVRRQCSLIRSIHEFNKFVTNNSESVPLQSHVCGKKIKWPEPTEIAKKIKKEQP